MNPIAVWYHCRLSGGEPNINLDTALSIMLEQMQALADSGLADAAQEIFVGVNGDNAVEACTLAPAKSTILHHPNGRSELPTLAHLRKWLPTHADWFVLYHHSKGVTQPQDGFHHHHRRVMQTACVLNWRQCVADLERGFDVVGVNWVDPVTRPVIPGRFFAGNFWWAKATYLLELPPIPDNALHWPERLFAEQWVGSAHRRPVALDYERPELSREWVMSGKVRAAA